MATEDRLRLLKLALLSACADPVNDVSAQSQLRRVAEILSEAAGENLAVTLREIMLRRLTLAQIAAPLQRPELKLIAYQVAVCICNADSAHSDPEHAFLEHLRVTLALDVRTARSFEREADAIIGVPLLSGWWSKDLIIEAATEREDIKAKIFEAAGKVLGANAIMASNTSSIPITPPPTTTRCPGTSGIESAPVESMIRS